jgi:hypothetical protein
MFHIENRKFSQRLNPTEPDLAANLVSTYIHINIIDQRTTGIINRSS